MRDYKQFVCPICGWELDNQLSFGKHVKGHTDEEVGSRVSQLLYSEYKYGKMCRAMNTVMHDGEV